MLASWRSMTKKAGSGSGSISQRHGSADPDPDSLQNVMDQEHCLLVTFVRKTKRLLVTFIRIRVPTKSWTVTLFTILRNLCLKKVKITKILPLPFYVFAGPGSGVHDPINGIQESKNQDSGSGINFPYFQHSLSIDSCWGPSAFTARQSYHSSSITSPRLTTVEVPQPPLLARPTTPHQLPLRGWRLLRSLSLHYWPDLPLLINYLSEVDDCWGPSASITGQTYHSSSITSQRLTPVEVPQPPLPASPTTPHQLPPRG